MFSTRTPLFFVALCAFASVLSASEASGQGLQAQFFDGDNFQTPFSERVDPEINFTNFNEEGRPGGLAATTWSARWTGTVRARHSELTTFKIIGDDGFRLWVDGKMLIEAWQGQGATAYEGQIQLQSGRRHEVMIEYFQAYSSASLRWYWSSPSMPEEIVPEDRLEPGGAFLSQSPEVSLHVTGQAARERSTDVARLSVFRWGSLEAPLEVAVSFDGTAVLGEDFSGGGESLTIPEGKSTAFFYLRTIDDFVTEGEETVDISLEPGEGYDLVAPVEASFTIEDDDEEPAAETHSIVGEVAYGGDRVGMLVVAAYEDADRAMEAGRTVLVQPGIYSIAGLLPGEYHVEAFIDEDGDGAASEGELALEAPDNPIMLPPDALGIDFDFGGGAMMPDPEPDQGPDGEPDADPEPEGDNNDPDMETPEPTPAPPSTGGGGDGEGCQTLPGEGSPAGALWGLLLLMLGWLGRNHTHHKRWS